MSLFFFLFLTLKTRSFLSLRNFKECESSKAFRSQVEPWWTTSVVVSCALPYHHGSDSSSLNAMILNLHSKGVRPVQVALFLVSKSIFFFYFLASTPILYKLSYLNRFVNILFSHRKVFLIFLYVIFLLTFPKEAFVRMLPRSDSSGCQWFLTSWQICLSWLRFKRLSCTTSSSHYEFKYEINFGCYFNL